MKVPRGTTILVNSIAGCTCTDPQYHVRANATKPLEISLRLANENVTGRKGDGNEEEARRAKE